MAQEGDSIPDREPPNPSVRRRLFIAMLSLAMIILTPFLVLSENTIKSLIDSWLKDCLVVIDTESLPPNKVRVTAYVSGETLKKLPLTFTASDALINRIKFSPELGPNAHSAIDNLARHPLTNKTCPGALCEEFGRIPSAPILTITLGDISPQFLYTFVVELDRNATKENLATYVQYEEGLKDGVCRVERANIFNVLARASKWQKFWAMVFIFLIVAVLISVIRGSTKDGSS